jgi:excisionase family DNA binding protein
MPIIIDNEEYLSVEEACAYLGGISRETLRRRTQASGIKKYSRGVTRNVYYRKADLDALNQLRPVDDDKH